MVPDKREEMRNLIPAYAIGALDDDERAEFEAWLEHDPEALVLLAEYQAIADQLVVLAPLRPAPEHLQADLRQRLTASKRDAKPAQLDRRASGGLGRVFKRRARWMLAAAAVLLVAVAGVLLLQYGAGDGEPETPDAAQLYDQLVAQPGSRQYVVVPGEVVDTVSGSLVVSPDGQQAVLRVSALPEITSDQIFQMWLVDEGGQRTSGGLFAPVTAQDTVFIQVPFAQSAGAYQGVGVSLEPAGGSPFEDRPTGPRVLSVPLS